MANEKKGKAKAKSIATKKPAAKKAKTPAGRAKTKSLLSDKKYVVYGVVTSPDARPAAGLTVIAYDMDVAGQNTLGQTITDAAGTYKISYSDSDFRITKEERENADVIVCVYSDGQELLFKSKKKNNSPIEYQLNVRLPAPAFVVRGVVRDAKDKPLANMLVRAFERDLRHPQLLGEGTTGADGDYRFAYQPADFLLGDSPKRRSPWLIVEVFESSEGKLLARQEVSKATRDEVVSFTVARTAAMSEWEEISEAAAPRLKGQGSARTGMLTHIDVKATPARDDLAPWDMTAADVDFIAQDAELERAAVQAWADSSRMLRDAVSRLSDEYADEQAVLREYGWPFLHAFARQGLARDLNTLLHESKTAWERAWNTALAANRVPALEKKYLAILMGALELLLRLAEIDVALTGNSEFGRILAITPLPLPHAVALDALTIAQEKGLDDTDALLALIKRHPEEEAPIKTFVRSIRVHRLASGHEGLTRILNARLDGASDAITPLATLNAADWISMAKDAGISAGLALRTQAQAERQYPLAALESKLKAGSFDLPNVSVGDVTALMKSQPDMTEKLLLGKLPVKEGESATIKVVRNTGRFMRTGIGMEVAAGLIKSGIESPGAASRHGSERLREQYRDKIPKEVLTELLERSLDEIRELADGGNGVVVGIKLNADRFDWIKDKDKSSLPAEVRENLPSLPGLFGDLDECICRPCESMLGQPAYLVDLLNLLAKSPSASGCALDDLRSRRKDIFDLELSCENADEPIQHIDIVLEVLEKAAAPEAAVDATLEEIQRIAYPKLRRAIYPWHLPFDRGYAEADAYLGKLGVSRGQLLQRLSNTPPAHLAAEALHAQRDQSVDSGADSEWELLTQKRSGAQLWAAYGFEQVEDIGIIDPASAESLTNQTVQDLLIRVSFLIARTGLSLEDLADTLNTEFVSGYEGGMRITGLEQCKTSAMRLPAEGQLLEEILDRLHRFTRLRAKLPTWSVEQLNDAITLCGGIETSTTTDQTRADVLVKLTIIKGLNEDHGLALDALLEDPFSAVRLRTSLGLSLLQFDLLKEMTAFNATAQPFDWRALESFCNAAGRLREIGLSIEQAAQALLTRTQWQRVAGELPPALKSDAQIESLLGSVQQRLRSIVAVNPNVSLEEQAAQALADIFDRATVARLLKAIQDAGAANVVDRVEHPDMLPILHGDSASVANRKLGEWSPLLTAELAKKIINLASGYSASERFDLLLDCIASRRRERELITVIAEQCGLAEPEVIPLLGSRLLLGPSDFASVAFLHPRFWDGNTAPSVIGGFSELHAWMDRLYRLISLRAALSIDAELMQLADCVAVGSSAGINWGDMLAVAPAWSNPQWQALLDLLWLQQAEQLSRPSLSELLSRLGASGASVSADTLRPLTARVDIDETLASGLIAQALSISTAPTLNDLRNPSKLRPAFEWLLSAKHLGASATQLAQLINLSDNALAADTAKRLLEAKLTGEEFKVSAQAIGDVLRRQRRDALVAYHVADIAGNNRENWRDAKALYEHFLIDPQMEPCFDTTRILEAVTATQLLAQRILFGIESEITSTPELRERWVWMRNYRVWEANRKVFLFPENWLFPELRDDKSSSFKQLESALGQGELTQDLAIQAFGQFLDDVEEMGQVQVLGMCEDIELDNGGSVVLESATGLPKRRNIYVVGRSANPPYFYFWRKCIDFGTRFMEWTPWNRIELDIQGDHVLLFVLGSQLHVAWPVFERRSVNSSAMDVVWHISLRWAHFNGSTWSRPSISRESDKNPINLNLVPFGDERSGFAFRCYVDQSRGDVTVLAFAMKPPSNTALNKPSAPSDERGYLATPTGQSVGDIFNLVNNGWDVFEIAFADIYRAMLEAWCLSEYVKTNHLASPFYTGLEIFGTNDHLEQHKLRLAADAGLRNWLSHVDQRGRLRDFIAAYESYAITKNELWRYENFVANMYMASHVREVRFRVWARVTIGGVAGLRELYSSNGSFVLQAGSESYPVTPGYASKLPFAPLMGDGIAKNYSLKWVGPDLTSQPEPLGEVPRNTRTVQTLHFEINASTLSEQTLSSLGITINREFAEVAQFPINRRGSVVPRIGTETPLAVPINDVEPWMNGFRLTEPSSSSQVLSVSQAGQRTEIFVGSALSERSWMVGQSSNRTGSETPVLWYFRDGEGACYIDLASPVDDVMRIYPDALQSARMTWLSWGENRTLPESSAQFDSGGAEHLPARSAGFATALPTAVSNGQTAFDQRLPYASFNWEIFFHAPLVIADQLSKQHKFEDAERWLRYVFDPTSSEGGSDPKRFLKFRVFKDLDLNEQVIDDLKLLAQVAGGYGDPESAQAVQKLIGRWRDMPFQPFMIARRRHVAFLWRTLFAYLDNLIAWADSLYRRDTRESINEATMLYVLAERILGRRPQLQQGKSDRPAYTYDQTISMWDEFANFWIDVGAQGQGGPSITAAFFPPVKQPTPDGMLYFCMPFNDKIMSYWNTVDARLSDIRNCRNIEGIKRSLSFMDAPIDPELLVRATASGLDLGEVIAGLYAPPPYYRYNILSARASELASEAKSLGAAMLSAIEKRDAERLAQLRSSNEIDLLKLVKDVRTLQIVEAKGNIEALRASRRTISARYDQYQRLLGKKGTKAPGENESAGEDAMLGTVGSNLASNRSSWGLIKEEDEQYEGFKSASDWSIASGIAKTASGVAHFAASPAFLTPGGAPGNILNAIGLGLSAVGDGFSTVSQGWQGYATQQGMMAGHIRRRDEWAFQSNQTLKELRQIDRQILANQIRIDITQKELDNHTEQIEQNQAVDEVMRSKFSNVQLYEWMKTELSRLYFSAYRMALDMAGRAERAAARELGVKPLNILGNAYWDSLRDGLLAGERLHQDIKRLEIAYLDQNRREYELTKHVSLRRLNPEALVVLRTKANGQCECEFDIPEWLFDLDAPGHYLRRIKSVSVSIPSVTGPYTSVNCKLTLLKSEVRHANTGSTGPEYLRASTGDDPRFSDYFGATEAIVTSTANADSGMFETQLRDERFLPFESSGVISTWRIELPGEYPQFDYSTISDVVLTIRYTARDGGDSLRNAATGSIQEQLDPTRAGFDPLRFPVLLSCRTDFPTEWARAKPSANLEIPITRDLLPYWMEAVRRRSGNTVEKLIVHQVLIADALKEPTAAPTFINVWPPADSTSLRTGTTPEWAGSSLVDGVGSGNTGPVPDTVADRWVLLSVGLQ